MTAFNNDTIELTERQFHIRKLQAQYSILSSLDAPQNSTTKLAIKVNKMMSDLLKQLEVLQNQKH